MYDADITIVVGTSHTFAVDVEMENRSPADLTQDGWQVHADIRNGDGVIYSWSLSAGNVMLAPDGYPNRILLHLSPEETKSWEYGVASWDLLVTVPDGRVARPVGGRVSFERPVTKL